MYKNKYQIYAVVRASQIIELNHDNEEVEYGSIDEIYENEHVQIYDVTNNIPVGHVNWYGDDEDMYEEIHQAITEYESKGEV